jgi:hypothetical protein
MDLIIWLAFQKEGATHPKSSISPSSSAEDDERVWLEVVQTLDTNMLSAMSSSFKWTNTVPPILQDLPSQMVRMEADAEADADSDPEHCGPASTSPEDSAGLSLRTQLPHLISPPFPPTQQHLLLSPETRPIDQPQSPSSPGSDRFLGASVNDSQRTMVPLGSSFTTSFHGRLISSPDYPMSPMPLPPTGFTPGTSPESQSKIQRSRILEDAPTVDPAAVMPQDAQQSPSQERMKPFTTDALARSPCATPEACSSHTIQQEFSHDVLQDSQPVDHDADVTRLPNNEAQVCIETSRQLERSASMEPERPPPPPRLPLRFHSDPPHTTPKLQDIPNAGIQPIPPPLHPAGMPSRRLSVFVEISGESLGPDDAMSAFTAAPQQSPSKRKRSTSSSDVSNESPQAQASTSPIFPTSRLRKTRSRPLSTIKITRNRKLKLPTSQAQKAQKLRKLEVSDEEKDGNDEGRKDETGLQTSSPTVKTNAIPSTSGGTAVAPNVLRNQPNGKPLISEFQ